MDGPDNGLDKKCNNKILHSISFVSRDRYEIRVKYQKMYCSMMYLKITNKKKERNLPIKSGLHT